MRRPTRLNRTYQQRSAVVASEVAVCLPLLFILLFGCLEVARANMLRHTAESAAYEGARVGIIPGATQQSIEDAVGFVMASVGATNFRVDVTPSAIVNSTQEVEVRVSIPYRENAFVDPFFLDDLDFDASCILQRETL